MQEKPHTINGTSYWMGSALLPGLGQMAQGRVVWGLLLLAAWISGLYCSRALGLTIYFLALGDALLCDWRARRQHRIK